MQKKIFEGRSLEHQVSSRNFFYSGLFLILGGGGDIRNKKQWANHQNVKNKTAKSHAWSNDTHTRGWRCIGPDKLSVQLPRQNFSHWFLQNNGYGKSFFFITRNYIHILKKKKFMPYLIFSQICTLLCYLAPVFCYIHISIRISCILLLFPKFICFLLPHHFENHYFFKNGIATPKRSLSVPMKKAMECSPGSLSVLVYILFSKAK